MKRELPAPRIAGKTAKLKAVASLGASLLLLLTVEAADPTPLTWRNPQPTSANLRALTFAQGHYLAVGEDDGRGNVFSTTDGTSWTFARCPTTNVLNGITFGAGCYVAVDAGGGIYASRDGVIWSAQESGTTNPLSAVAYGDSKFVAVGGQNRIQNILTSGDGTNWSVQTLTDSSASRLNGVAYGNGTWVAVGDPWPDQAPVFVSSNALDWTNRAVAVFPGLGFKAVTYGPAGFTAVGDGYENQPPVLFSANGNDWLQVSVSNSWYLYLKAVCAAKGTLVAVGSAITTSSNGINWSAPIALSSGAALAAIAGSPDGFLSVGSTGTVATSPDGTDWSFQRSGVTAALSGLIYARGTFLAVGSMGSPGYPGPGVVAQSTDGAAWSFAPLTNNPYADNSLHDVVFANGLYVAVGGQDGGNIETSPDGLTWTSRYPANGAYNAVTHGPAGFVAVGANYLGGQAIIAGSRDGFEWTNRNSGLTNTLSYYKYLNGVTCGSGRYVAVGLLASIVYSDDATNWHPAFGNTSADLYDVLFTNGTFIAVGGQGTIRTSTNATSWRVVSSGFTDTLYHVSYGNGTYVVVGAKGALAISTDTLTWVKLNSGTTLNLRDVIYGNGTFVIVGDSGAILQSASFRPFLRASSGPQGFALTLTGGESDVVYRLQAASAVNFLSPSDLLVYSNTGSPLTFSDTGSASQPKRFYRLIAP